MVKHTQTNCLSMFDHFVGLTLEGIKLGGLLLWAAGKNFFEEIAFRNVFGC